jgi:hypothetical protein
MPCIGRSTCASASALSLDAQPAQLDRLVNRICFPEGLASSWIMMIGFPLRLIDVVIRGFRKSVDSSCLSWMCLRAFKL